MLPLKFTWNPITGIDLGFLYIHFYSLTYVVSFWIGLQIMKRIYANEDIPEAKLDSLTIYTIVSILLGARLGHVLFYQTELLWEDPLSVLLPFRFVPEIEFTGFRGLASHGATIATLIGMHLYNKKVLHKTWLWILDRLVIPSALGAMFVRIGNFFNSEMVGKVTDSSLGIRFVQDEISEGRASQITGIKEGKKALQALTEDPSFAEILSQIPFRYPGQLMEAAGYGILFIVLMFLYWKTDIRKKEGRLLGAFLLLLMGVRLIVEYFKREQVVGREDLLLGLNTGQLLSIPFILLGIYLVLRPLKKTD